MELTKREIAVLALDRLKKHGKSRANIMAAVTALRDPELPVNEGAELLADFFESIGVDDRQLEKLMRRVGLT